MLEVLRAVVQEVNAARGLDDALRVIVTRVKPVMNLDVCSVYLTNPDSTEHVLRATDGFDQAMVGSVSIPFGHGLVGLVAERAEPVNLSDGHRHPRFHYVEETGEARLHGFLGVPIVRHRKVLGIIVAQREETRDFSDDEVSLLVTLAAQLAGAITHAETVGEVKSAQQQSLGSNRFFDGLPGAPGVAIGEAVVVYSAADLNTVPDRRCADRQAEEEGFLEAVRAVREEIAELSQRMEGVLPEHERAVFEAFRAMLSGDSLVTETVDRIRMGTWAPAALRDTVRDHARVFESMSDPYLAERASDIRDLGRRVLTRMQMRSMADTSYPENAVLVGEEISAMDLAEADVTKIAGVVSVHGSGYSHVAILARALGVPCVMGVSDLPVSAVAERKIIADGYSGRVYVEPSGSVRDEFDRLRQEEAELSARLAGLQGLPAETPDGVRVPLYANTGLAADIAQSVRNTAEGIGLYRTEFPFLIRDRFPAEDEQVRIYRHALESFAPGPVVIRTLDAGGDKALPYFPISEDNPFLGWRGIRMTLDHPEIFLTQLRAMIRADEGLGNLSILLPMISSIHEVDEALELLEQALAELSEEGIETSRPKVGVMVEVPSVVYQIEALAERVDFFSVGTNDLTQYLLAVDRNNERVAELYDHLHPGVIRALRDIVYRAHAHGRPVSVCGEMADDPAGVILLLGMGVDSLSMSAGSLSRIKWVVRSFSKVRAEELLARALAREDALDIRELLTAAVVDQGLGGLIRAGKL